MIEVIQLRKEMDGKPILEDISFQLERGTISGLIGRNGTGKTTLLRLMMGILLPDQGDVRYEEKSVYEHPEVKIHMMYLPENKLILQNDTIMEAVRSYRMFYPDFDAVYVWQKTKDFHLPIHKKIRQLSKGMKALFSLILAFATRADVILLDEPTDGLDAIVKRQWYEMLVDEVAERKHTVLISSHRLSELESICDRIMILNEGRIETQSDLTSLKSKYLKLQIVYDKEIPTEIAQMDHIRLLSQSGRIITLMVDESRKEEVIARIDASQPVLMDVLPLSLEELFVATVGDEKGGIKGVD